MDGAIDGGSYGGVFHYRVVLLVNLGLAEPGSEATEIYVLAPGELSDQYAALFHSTGASRVFTVFRRE